MSYSEEQLGPAIVQIGAGAADVLTATGVHTYAFSVMHQVIVRRIMAKITTAVTCDTVAPVITFKKRPTYGSASGESTIGTLTIPDDSAVSTVVYKNVTPVVLAPGDQVVFDVTTAGTDSSSAAGGAVYGFVAELDPEQPGNQSNMVASA